MGLRVTRCTMKAREIPESTWKEQIVSTSKQRPWFLIVPQDIFYRQMLVMVDL